MSVLNWIVLSGSATWTAASFDTASLPANGDTVNILQGNADINAGLSQSGVTLAALNIGPGFSGTIGTSATPAVPLAIGVSGTVLINCQSAQICLDLGTTTPAIAVAGTGVANGTALGQEAVRIRGGGSTVKYYISGSSSIGVGTDYAGLAANASEWNLSGGTLNIGSAVTWTSGYQSGGVATVNSGGTLIQQSSPQPQVILGGGGVVTTMNITGSAIASNRPASGTDAFATISIGPNASVDASQDPRPLTITNPVLMATGAALTTFDPQQMQLHSGPLQVLTQQCGISDVTLNIGGPVLATLTT